MRMFSVTCCGCCVSLVGAVALMAGSTGFAGSTTLESASWMHYEGAESILGMWECTADFGDGNELPFTMELEDFESEIGGSLETGDGQMFELSNGKYDAQSGEFTALVFEPGDSDGADLSATFEEDSFEGEVNTPDGQVIVIKGEKAD